MVNVTFVYGDTTRQGVVSETAKFPEVKKIAESALGITGINQVTCNAVPFNSTNDKACGDVWMLSEGEILNVTRETADG